MILSFLKGLRWKWVVIALVMYVFLYFLPLFLVAGIFSDRIPMFVQLLFSTCWTFIGLLVISSLTGYLSTGVTILEPVIASVVLIILIPISQDMYTRFTGQILPMPITDYGTLMIVVFVLTFIGAWFGEHVHGMFRHKNVSENN
jgi:hypothetical protein